MHEHLTSAPIVKQWVHRHEQLRAEFAPHGPAAHLSEDVHGGPGEVAETLLYGLLTLPAMLDGHWPEGLQPLPHLKCKTRTDHRVGGGEVGLGGSGGWCVLRHPNAYAPRLVDIQRTLPTADDSRYRPAMPLSTALQAIVARLSAGGRPEVIPPTTLPSEREAMLDAIAASAARDPRVKAVADGLYTKLADRLGRAPPRPELLQWLMDSVHLLADYAPDLPGEEVFQSVQYTLWGGCGAGISPLTGQQKGCADCEDQAALLVALCLALGIRARVKWLDQPGSPLNHVSAMALLDGGQWICTDATIPGARPGETPYQALDRVGPGFRSRIFGLENAAGGIFAPAGYPAPMRYRPAGTNAEVRVMNLMQLPRTSWQFMLDGAPVTPIWTTPEGTVLFRTTSGQHTFTIIDPIARSRTWNLTVPSGVTALDWSAPDVAILIHDFPTSRMEVTLDGAPVGDRGGWADYSARIYRVLAPIGRHTLRIADASGAARVWTGDLDAGGLTRNYADIQPERRLVASLGSLRILNMIPSARVLVDDVDRTADGNWIAGAAPYTWGDLSLPAGAHTVSVLPRAPSDGPTVNARSITVNAGAQTTMETGWLPRAATPEATSRLVIVGMPAGGAVAVNGTNIPHERSLAMVPPPDVGAEGLNWPVPVAPGNVTVRVTPPDGQGPARTATLMVPATGAAVRFSAMTPEATSRASEIEVRNIIPGSRLFVNGADVTDSGRIVDVASRTFAVPAPAGRVNFRVVAPDGTTRIPATPITVPSAGAFTVDWNRMVPDVTVEPDSSVPATFIRLLNAPSGGSVVLDGLNLAPPWASWIAGTQNVRIGALPGPHILRVLSSGSPRVANVTVPLTGSVDVDFNTMREATDSGAARVGRIVVRGAPTGISPARVVIVGGVSGDPAQSQPLTPQSDGYLAVTWPVGPARLQVGTFDVPVTVILGTDSVYDYTPAGLVFQPLVTNARMAPNAGTGPTGADPSQGSVVLSGVPLPETNHAPLAAALAGTSQYLAELHGGGPVVTLRPSGTDFVGNAAPGTYVLTVYFETSRHGRPATRSPIRSATVNLTAGQIERVSWSDMAVPAVDGTPAQPAPAPADDAHSRMSLVGVPDGWTFAVDGLTSQPPEGLTRGPHTVVLRNPQGVTVQREVTLRNAEETVDMAYDVARALQFVAGHDGIVNVTEDGLRNGYPSTFSVEANRAAQWLTPAEERRVMREFDVVGAWRDAAGRMPVALYFKGAGMTIVPLTPAELLARAKNLPKRGSRRKDGTYVNDLRIPTT